MVSVNDYVLSDPLVCEITAWKHEWVSNNNYLCSYWCLISLDFSQDTPGPISRRPPPRMGRVRPKVAVSINRKSSTHQRTTRLLTFPQTSVTETLCIVELCKVFYKTAKVNENSWKSHFLKGPYASFHLKIPPFQIARLICDFFL